MPAKPHIYTFLPHLLTLGNLFLGALGITLAFEGCLLQASYYIIFAAILDFFDGFVARLLKLESHLGRELDSLADVISFGMLPSVLILKTLEAAGFRWSYLAYVILLCSAYRLAVFNLDEKQYRSFLGLPTPANALFWAGFTHLHAISNWTTYYLSHPYLILPLTFIMGILLVIRLPFLSFKTLPNNKSNLYQFILLLVAVLTLIVLGYAGMAIIIIIYILLSLLRLYSKGITDLN